MQSLFSRVLGVTAVATTLTFSGAASAIAIQAGFNFVPFGTLTANTGDVTTASTITAGDPLVVTTIILNNVGLVSGQALTVTTPTPVASVGQAFVKIFTTALGTFTENLTIQTVSIGVSSRSITATGTITSTNPAFDPTPVFYSASYTQNGGPGNQINVSYNNSTTPPNRVPEPATLALLGAALAGLGFARKRKQA